MTGLIIFISIVLLFVILAQVSRITDTIAALKGDDDFAQISRTQSGMLVAFMVLGFIGIFWSIDIFKDRFLGTSASEHGHLVDSNFNWTLLFTGIVFVITQILLAYYTIQYREKKGRKALFFAGSNKLEVIWTLVPAVVLTGLVVNGVSSWFTITGPASEQAMTIEAVGKQFGWTLRYPGKDGVLGKADFRLVSPTNEIGIDFTDPASRDDLIVTELHLPKDQEIEVKIRALDVLHSFNLPHFRVKMDAVPGVPTRFKFTPTHTSAEYAELMKEEGKVFSTFELACTELCGYGHNSMRRVVVVDDETAYQEWENKQTPIYELIKDQLGMEETNDSSNKSDVAVVNNVKK